MELEKIVELQGEIISLNKVLRDLDLRIGNLEKFVGALNASAGDIFKKIETHLGLELLPKQVLSKPEVKES